MSTKVCYCGECIKTNMIDRCHKVSESNEAPLSSVGSGGRRKRKLHFNIREEGKTSFGFETVTDLSSMDIVDLFKSEEQGADEQTTIEQHGWFVFVGDAVNDYKLVHDYAVILKEELEERGISGVTIKKAFVKVDV